MDPDSQIQQYLAPFVRIYKSGRIERLLGTDVLPAGVDPETGVTSMDVVINPETDVVARLYLPNLTNDAHDKKLPILVYYHGGGFIIETAFSPTYHYYLNTLVAKAKVVAVSVNYRRVPEHVLPAAYDDSWEALQWVASHARGNGSEAWLTEHGDFGSVFLAGDSAGANIVHDMTVRAMAEALENGVQIKGVALIHPFFEGEEPVGSEPRDPEQKERLLGMWKFVCPSSTAGLDDPRLNPLVPGAPSLKGLPCRSVLVAVAQKDFLRERGWAYYEALKKSGWEGEAKFLESEGEEHVFHLKQPNCDKAVEKMQVMVAFLNSH